MRVSLLLLLTLPSGFSQKLRTAAAGNNESKYVRAKYRKKRLLTRESLVLPESLMLSNIGTDRVGLGNKRAFNNL